MLRYRGPKLVKAGFIGAFLIVLSLLWGLRPTSFCPWRHRSVTRRCSPRSRPRPSRGNAVTVSGMKVGSVSGRLVA